MSFIISPPGDFKGLHTSTIIPTASVGRAEHAWAMVRCLWTHGRWVTGLGGEHWHPEPVLQPTARPTLCRSSFLLFPRHRKKEVKYLAESNPHTGEKVSIQKRSKQCSTDTHGTPGSSTSFSYYSTAHLKFEMWDALVRKGRPEADKHLFAWSRVFLLFFFF